MLLVAGTRSGCGKSTLVLGLIAALKNMGRVVQPFKAGPDFIDPGLHTLVSGRRARNLDLWMCGPRYVKETLRRHSAGADSIIIEGVMGLYDGGERSSAALSRAVGAKTLLVVDAYGMAESAGAIVKGFAEYGPCGGIDPDGGIDPCGGIDAVVFNRVGSEAHFNRLRGLDPIGPDRGKRRFQPEIATGYHSSVAAPSKTRCFQPEMAYAGYLPRDSSFTIPERHLGLRVAEERPLSGRMLDKLAQSVAAHIDMELIDKLARNSFRRNSFRFPPAPAHSGSAGQKGVRIAIARDRAFCFYYEDNLDLLEREGASLVPFSPVRDRSLPEKIDAVYLGGGYPELHAGALSRNSSMRQAINRFAESGRPVYAECGGLMYLGEGIFLLAGEEKKEKFYPMCAVFPFATRMKKARPALGYREAVLGGACILGKKGEHIRGHEFHYSEFAGKKEDAGTDFLCGPLPGSARYKSTLASYTHVHFGSNPRIAPHFINYIRENARG